RGTKRRDGWRSRQRSLGLPVPGGVRLRPQHAESDMHQAKIGAALVLLALPLAALAQTTPSPPSATTPTASPSPALKQARLKMRAACAADMQKFCANVQRGPAMQSCMREHRAELSPECTAARSEFVAIRRKEKG